MSHLIFDPITGRCIDLTQQNHRPITYTPLHLRPEYVDEKAHNGQQPVVLDTSDPAADFEHSIEFACSLSTYKQMVDCRCNFLLGKTDNEPAITQWNAIEKNGNTLLTAKVMTQEPKKVIQRFNGSEKTSFSIKDVSVVEKESLTADEGFVPVKVAVQVGEQLGWPTEGYIYHFIGGKLQSEYQILGEDRWAYVLTGDIQYKHHLHHILLPWKQHGQLVNNQHLVYLTEKLKPEQVNETWLNENGLKIDLPSLIDVAQGASNRASYIVSEGDSLSEIADANDISMADLIAFNPELRGRKDNIKPQQKLYLAPISVYNHPQDVGYTTNTRMLAKDIGVISAKNKEPFTVVNIAEYKQDFVAISPVRYALDTPTKPGEEQPHPLPDNAKLDGGIFRKASPDYTLRQLRDGWLYVLYQDDNSEQFLLDEYNVSGQVLTRYPGKNYDERLKSEPKKGKGFLLYPSKAKLYIAFSYQRWTENLCTYFCTKEEPRNDWMRVLDLATCRENQVPEHCAPQAQMKTYVADMEPSKFRWSDLFASSCAPLSGEISTCLFIKPKPPGLAFHSESGVPFRCDQIMVALDDPLADFTDLYLRLLKPSLMVTPVGDEAHRKWIVAEQIRQMVRVPLAEDELPEKVKNDPLALLSFEQELDQCFELGCDLKNLTKRLHTPTARSTHEWSKLTTRDINEKQIQIKAAKDKLKSDYGFTPTEKQQKHWDDLHPLRQEVKLTELNRFYREHVIQREEYQPAIPAAFDKLLAAFNTLGAEPFRVGIDVGNSAHLAYLIELLADIVQVLSLNATDEEQRQAITDAVNQTEPGNLMAVTFSCFSAEFHGEINQWGKDNPEIASATKINELTRPNENSAISTIGDGTAAVGRLVDLDALYGLTDNGNSKLYKKTMALLSPFADLKASFKGALKLGISSSWQKLSLTLWPFLQARGDISPLCHKLLVTLHEKVIQGHEMEFTEFLTKKAARRLIQAAKRWANEEAKLNKFKLRKAELKKIELEEGHLSPSQVKELEGIESGIKKSIATSHEQSVIVANEINSTAKGRAASSKVTTEHVGKSVSRQKKIVSDSIGGIAGIAVMFNYFNTLSAMEDLNDALLDADKEVKERILAANSLWFANAVAGVFQGSAMTQVSKNGMLDVSIGIVLEDATYSLDKQALVKSFFRRTLAMSAAGVLAATFEGYQTWEDYNNADFSYQKNLLILKLVALGGQGVAFAGMFGFTVASGMSAGTEVVIAKTFTGLMGSGLFWLGILYLGVTILLNVTAKTPLQTWLGKTVWGVEPKGWTASEEYQALVALLRQPFLSLTSTTPLKPGDIRYDHFGNIIISNQEKRLDITIPQISTLEEIKLYVTINKSYYRQFVITKEVLEKGQWQINAPDSTYRLLIPSKLESTDTIEVYLERTTARLYHRNAPTSVNKPEGLGLYYGCKLTSEKPTTMPIISEDQGDLPTAASMTSLTIPYIPKSKQ